MTPSEERVHVDTTVGNIEVLSVPQLPNSAGVPNECRGPKLHSKEGNIDVCCLYLSLSCGNFDGNFVLVCLSLCASFSEGFHLRLAHGCAPGRMLQWVEAPLMHRLFLSCNPF